MEVNVSKIVALTEDNPFRFSASQAEIGENAAQITWENSKDVFQLFGAMEGWKEEVTQMGGWDREELAEWSDGDFNALFVQFVSSEYRQLSDAMETFGYDIEDFSEREFFEATETQGGRLYKVGQDWFYHIGI